MSTTTWLGTKSKSPSVPKITNVSSAHAVTGKAIQKFVTDPKKVGPLFHIPARPTTRSRLWVESMLETVQQNQDTPIVDITNSHLDSFLFQLHPSPHASLHQPLLQDSNRNYPFIQIHFYCTTLFSVFFTCRNFLHDHIWFRREPKPSPCSVLHPIRPAASPTQGAGSDGWLD